MAFTEERIFAIMKLIKKKIDSRGYSDEVAISWVAAEEQVPLVILRDNWYNKYKEEFYGQKKESES